MRILDKNTDFYDYLSGIYRDDSIVFNRTDSFVLTKDIVCDHIWKSKSWDKSVYRFALLQICSTFWLFFLEITSADSFGKPTDYRADLIAKWKNYDKPRKMIQLDIVEPGFGTFLALGYRTGWKREYDRDAVMSKASVLVSAVDAGDYRVRGSIDSHIIYRGDNVQEEKHIPLLKASGLVPLMEPLDVYLAFEEYFSLEKQVLERTESKGITDQEKAENHGFDRKTSFRGKQ